MINAILSLFGGPVAAPAEPAPARPFEGVLAGLIPGWTGEAEGQRRPTGTPEAAAAASGAPELVGLGIRLRTDWARPTETAPGAGNEAGAPAALAPTAADDGTDASQDPATDEPSDAGVPTAAGGPGAPMRSEAAGTSERRTDAESATPPAAAGPDGSLAPDAGEGTAAASDRRADIRGTAAPAASADRPDDTDGRDGATNGSAAAAGVSVPAVPGRTDTPTGLRAADRATEQGRGQGATLAPEQSPARPGGREQRAEGSADVAGTGAPPGHGGPQRPERPARPAGAAALRPPWGPGWGKASGNSPATGDGARSDSARAATGPQEAPQGSEMMVVGSVDLDARRPATGREAGSVEERAPAPISDRRRDPGTAENRATEPGPRSSAAESATVGGGEADGGTRTDGRARTRADIAASARAFARRRMVGKDGAGETDSRRPGSVAALSERSAGSDEAEAGPSSDRRPLTVDGAARRGPAGTDPGTLRSVDPVRGPDAAARVETIDALREQEARQPLHRVSVRVGEGESATRVRVNLRGDVVQSEMATESKPLASRLGRELPELNRALQSQGLETDGLRVRHGDRVVAADPGPTRTAASPRSGGESQEQMNQRSGSQHEPHDGRRRHREHSNEEGNE